MLRPLTLPYINIATLTPNVEFCCEQDGLYWRFNDRAFRIDTADPPFPRPAGYWWFGCAASGSQVKMH